MKDTSKIVHIDMDAFFAAVEQRDNPALRGKPVVVGGDPESRGVVCTASYEARKFGIHSAMPSRQAYLACPHAIFLHPRFEAYKEASQQIREIFSRYTDLVEPLSLDEAYLDVTQNKVGQPSATLLAESIRRDIYAATQLTASAGVSYNKFLAKVASDMNKPDGITVITPDQAQDFIDTLSIRKFHGVGVATERKMKALGIHNGVDLRSWDKMDLMQQFGKAGLYYYNIVRGVDSRPVVASRERKSLGKETTFDFDVGDKEKIQETLQGLAEEVEGSARRKKILGRTITLKVRYDDFETLTRSQTVAKPTRNANEVMAVIETLMSKTEIGDRDVRLVGLSLTNLVSEGEHCLPQQLELPLVFP